MAALLRPIWICLAFCCTATRPFKHHGLPKLDVANMDAGHPSGMKAQSGRTRVHAFQLALGIRQGIYKIAKAC